MLGPGGQTAIVVRILTAARKPTSFHDLPGKQQAACGPSRDVTRAALSAEGRDRTQGAAADRALLPAGAAAARCVPPSGGREPVQICRLAGAAGRGAAPLSSPHAAAPPQSPPRERERNRRAAPPPPPLSI